MNMTQKNPIPSPDSTFARITKAVGRLLPNRAVAPDDPAPAVVTPSWTIVRSNDVVSIYSMRDHADPSRPDVLLSLRSRPLVWTASTEAGAQANGPGEGVAVTQRKELQFSISQRRVNERGEGCDLTLVDWTMDEALVRRQFETMVAAVFDAYGGTSPSGNAAGVRASSKSSASRKQRLRWFASGAVSATVVLVVWGLLMPSPSSQAALAAAAAGRSAQGVDPQLAAAAAGDPALKALLEGANVPMPKEFAALPAEQQRALMEAALTGARPDPVGATAQDQGQKALTLNADQLASLKRAYALTIGNGPKTVYVFEDPNCSSCQRLSQSIEQMDKSEFTFKLLPVAFLDGSMPIAVGAMCLKDQTSAWLDLLKGVPLMNPAKCAAGTSVIEGNNQLFRSLGLNSTPTLIASSGAVVTGDGSPDAIRRWANSQTR